MNRLHHLAFLSLGMIGLVTTAIILCIGEGHWFHWLALLTYAAGVSLLIAGRPA